VPGSAPEPSPDSLSGSTSGPLAATLASRTVIAPGIADITLAMQSPSSLKFRAGQFVSIGVVPGQAATAPAPSGGSVRRSYSIASPSSQGDQLRFIIRVIPEGAASEFLMRLPMGAEVRMTGPYGFFVLDADHAGDIVFGATGTGVAAVMPMLSELVRRPARGRRLLYWGVRHQDDFFARSEIEALCREAGCDLILFVSGPSPEWTGARGRITPAILDELPRLASPTFYLVGNGAMISELKRELVARGINRKKQIRTEAFFD
jgi:ferredoxin-NADP reductase